MRQDEAEETRGPRPEKREARRYEPPAIEWEEPLTAVAQMAAACAKFPMADPQCSTNPQAS